MAAFGNFSNSSSDYNFKNFQETIKLMRSNPNSQWGFRLQGGAGSSIPLRVQQVQIGSIAYLCGLQSGDRILLINSVQAENLTHDEAKSEILRSGNEVSFLIERGNFMVQQNQPQISQKYVTRSSEMQITATSNVHNAPELKVL